MGAGHDAARARRLAQMGSPVREVEYQHPPESECDVEDTPVWVSATERLAVNIWFFQKRIVRFCIELTIREDDEWHVVCRIDTCHGVVHRHQMTRSGGESKTTRVRLPGDDDDAAWAILGREYEASHVELTTRCDDYVKEWRTT